MKACLYLEFRNFLGGVLFDKIGTGLLSSYLNQKTMLDQLDVPYSEKYDESCDVIVINTPWLKSIYLAQKAQRKGKKVIIWSHVTVEDAKMVFRFFPLVRPLLKKYLTYAYSIADIILCPSDYTKTLLVAYGLDKEKIIVQSNGVDLGAFYSDEIKRNEYRNKYNLNSFSIGSIGLAIPRKGIDTFLFAAKELPDMQFIWYGKIYNKLLVKALPKNMPRNVRFTGYVDDILSAFNSLDVFIFPSYEENQGMAILEAAAVGLPILVRDIKVYNGWLVHGENCLKAKNDKEFVDCMRSLSTDAELRERLKQGAKALAEKENSKILGLKMKEILSMLSA